MATVAVLALLAVAWIAVGTAIASPDAGELTENGADATATGDAPSVQEQAAGQNASGDTTAATVERKRNQAKAIIISAFLGSALLLLTFREG